MSDTKGFSLLEVLVATVILLTVSIGLAGLLIQNSRINKTQQMTARAQADARNCLMLVVQKLRSAGWDPLGIGFVAVTPDPDLGDAISQIEVRADLNDDGDIDDDFEQLLIRHRDNVVEWRKTTTANFETLMTNITNDADGNGTPEPMFVLDGVPPTRITVSITAQSSVPELLTQQHILVSLSSDIVLREAL